MPWTNYCKANIPVEIWAWDFKQFQDLNYFKHVGNPIAWTKLPKHLENVRKICDKIKCPVSLRMHPWKPHKKYRGLDPRYMPRDVWKYEEEKLYKELAAAVTILPNVKYVFIDLETWMRNKVRHVEYNEAMHDTAQMVINLIKIFYKDAIIEGYNFNSLNNCWSLYENFSTASCSAYYSQHSKNIEIMERVINFQIARNLDSTTLYATFGAGWEKTLDNKREWNWNFGLEFRRIWGSSLARTLKSPNFWSIHKVIDYSAFHVRNIYWENWFKEFLDEIV